MQNKEKINKNTIIRLLKYIWKDYKFLFILSIICVIINALVSVVSSIFIKNLIDDYISPLLLSSNPDFSLLLNKIIEMAVLFGISILAAYLSSIFMNIISQSILKDIRNEMFSHMESLPIKYFDTHSHGDVMSYYTNDIDAIEQLYSQSIMQILSTIVTVVVVFFTMVFLNLLLTFVVLLTVAIMYYFMGKVSKKSSKYFKKNQESIGKINGFIEETMNGQKVVKVFNHEEKIEERFDQLNEEWFENNYYANKYANILMPIMGNLTNLQYVIIAVIGGLLAINNVGVITVGLIASFLQLSKRFSMPVSRLAQQINSIIMAIAGASRIFSLLDEESEVDDGYITLVNIKNDNGKMIETNEVTNNWAFKKESDGEIEYVPLKGDVRLQDVTFAYQDDNIVLHDIDLYAKPGQKIAFVGSTGAGKTTITNLLNRFYDISSGTIIYDGINIKDIKKSDLRKSLGIVLQDTNLFTGTILDNLRFGNPNATMDEVIAACELANATSFIERLPDGYDTMITNNGSNLSQGQRQLLSIARAALVNPPVMILDEATSSIDTRTEKIVQDGMDKLMQNRTVFVIAHRLSTVQNSKAIIVLEHGRIIERGSHDELLKEKGVYYELYTGKCELE